MAKKKRKGHPGFSHDCRKLMTYKEWEKKVKGVKRSNKHVNPYAVVNGGCKTKLRSRRRKKR